jgi:anti-anti-sigma factor
MTLDATLSMRKNTAVIALDGDLDAATAQVFQNQAERAAEQRPDRLVLDMRKLGYLSSAGLRQLVYARQKMDDDVHVVLVGANEQVTQVIRLVGFEQSVIFSDDMPE